MIRFFLKTLSFIAFAIALMFVVIDATRSIGVSSAVFTPFGESLELVIPTLLATFRDWLAGAAPEFVSDPLLVSLFALPTFAVFAVLALLLYALGRKPPEKGLKRRPR